MSEIKISAEVLQEIKKFNRNVEWLKKKELKTNWVKASVITDLTGWDKHSLWLARKNGYVKYKKDGSTFWYDPSSLTDIFLKKSG